jgi:hypothetical protein
MAFVAAAGLSLEQTLRLSNPHHGLQDGIPQWCLELCQTRERVSFFSLHFILSSHDFCLFFVFLSVLVVPGLCLSASRPDTGCACAARPLCGMDRMAAKESGGLPSCVLYFCCAVDRCRTFLHAGIDECVAQKPAECVGGTPTRALTQAPTRAVSTKGCKSQMDE